MDSQNSIENNPQGVVGPCVVQKSHTIMLSELKLQVAELNASNEEKNKVINVFKKEISEMKRKEEINKEESQ